MIDLPSFCYGAFASVCVIGAVSWVLWHYWPEQDRKDRLPETWKPREDDRQLRQ